MAVVPFLYYSHLYTVSFLSIHLQYGSFNCLIKRKATQTGLSVMFHFMFVHYTRLVQKLLRQSPFCQNDKTVSKTSYIVIKYNIYWDLV